MPTNTGLALRPTRLRSSTFLVALIALTASAHAQNRYEWTVYSALNSVQSVAIDDDGTIWAGTTGGVVGYHRQNNAFEVFRTTEGLLTLNTTAVGVDPASGDLYAGAADGSISIRSRDGRWHGVTDIVGVERADRRINDFRFRNGLVYVLTAFGVAVLDPTDTTFPETWTRFGSLPPNIPVNDVLFWRDSIWLATDNGIARAPENGVLLPNPLSWTIFDTTSGYSGARALSLAVIGDELVVGTNAGVFTRGSDGRFSRREELTTPDPILLAMSGDRVAAATLFAVYTSDQGAQFRPTDVASPVAIRDLALGPDGTIAIAANEIGIGVIESGTLRIVAPSAPVSNFFSDLALAPDGSIWASSGQWGSGRGLSRLRDGVWEQFTSGRYPGLMLNHVQNVGIGGDGAIWAGAFDSGAVRIMPRDTGADVQRYARHNSPLYGIKPNPDFIIVTDAVGDPSGRTWMLNWDNTQAPGGPLLVVHVTPEEAAVLGREFVSFLRPPTALDRNFRWIIVDQNGTKWLGSDQPGNTTGLQPSGLTFYTSREHIEQEGEWGRLGIEHGLVSNQQTALAADLDGAIWIGAPNGLSVLDNPVTVATQGAQTARVRNSDREPGNCCRALREVFVTALAVDALNRKWVGTNQGIFVLSPDGIDVVARFTSANSPLVDDDIRSLLAVHETGDLFIGTANGLNRVSTDAVESPTPVSAMTVWPQPFLVPAEEPARIAGLPPNASVKVLTASGRLVRQFDSPGGAVAFWDGLGDDGEPVPSGVYIVAAGANSGEETVVGKIAVVRR